MPLSWKVYLTSLTCALCSVALLSVAVTYDEGRRALADLRSQKQLVARIAASQVQVGYHETVWPFQMLRAMAHEPSITSWWVVDGDGAVRLSSEGLSHRSQAPQATPTSLLEPTLVNGEDPGEEVWVVPMEMRSAEQPWSFQLVFRTDSVRAGAARIFRANALYALLVAILLVPISYLASRRFLRPLQALTHAARELGAGHHQATLPPSGDDEIGQLVDAFGAMSASILDRDARIGEQLEAIRCARDELEQRVEERTEELAMAMTAAEKATAAKSHFLANMSHEIRTPMTAIQGYADVLLDSDSTEEERALSARTIKSSGAHLIALINDILDISKIEAGKMSVERIPWSPTEVVGDAAAMMRERATGKGLDFEVELVGPLPRTVLTDPARLRQILVNLLGNAIKFTEQGRVRMVVSYTPGLLEFRIEDTGIGMTPEQLESLFRPFAQADGSATRRFGGTGLGLSISRELAHMLGGEIRVDSEEGAGSTFTATISVERVPAAELDLAPSLVDRPHEASEVRPTTRLGGSVLLVEDNPVNARLVGSILQKAGAEVTRAENGRLAVDAALAAQAGGEPFVLILMDMQMPVLDGYSATKELRAAGYGRPIVALTAHAMASDRDDCIACGCDDFLTKPIQRAQLLEVCALWMRANANDVA